ncbi:ead/Ea22-like family protein [Escherichia marmotae]|nr:ead/Ea22-like family protein [Escherichia marmotae]MDQ9267471.1 ead/Ea22-like family protein [Escherichia marmotae]HAV8839811.1 ead/Ea22-like family protein [Escherichia coli]
MSKIDYQALRAKAEKATCGEWSLEYGDGRFDGDDALIHREVAGYIPICRIEGAHPESGFDEDFQMEQQANAEFIAAANPATVLALLDERERNLQYIKSRDQENEDIALTVGKLRVELEAAKKRIAELEAEPVSQTYKLNELSGNSPVTPDGWVIVPKELTPEMMRAVQIRSELGGYATSNLSGAYNMFSEFWNVAVSAAPKVDDL